MAKNSFSTESAGVKQEVNDTLKKLGVDIALYAGKGLVSKSAITGTELSSLQEESKADVAKKVAQSEKAFEAWRKIPAPLRGELIRLYGEELRKHKYDLALLVSHEAGKITSEARGEVQEQIDICDYAVGLSRMIGGKTLPSERPNHTLEEKWEPLGPVGVITAFNFPVAVADWNRSVSVICGNSVIHKPSEITPLTALASQSLFDKACEVARAKGIEVPANLSQVLLAGRQVSEEFVKDKRVKLVSATGSCAMGRVIQRTMAGDLGRRYLLELGGNNPVVLTESTDLSKDLASIIFGAMGTAGQRCTSTRRLLVPESRYEEVLGMLKKAYQQVAETKDLIGDPRQQKTLIGPLIHEKAAQDMQKALTEARSLGASVYCGEPVDIKTLPQGVYVQPALVDMANAGQKGPMLEETFAPILYVLPYKNLDEAIAKVNEVQQGLSAAIFTNDLKEAAKFKRDVVAGIVNVNAGTSGAEIGGAFGGEKDTGGGRESGSDSWKQYMRRVTSTTYYGDEKAKLAQGVQFSL